MTEHGFTLKLWNAEHRGMMDDEVAELLSCLMVWMRDDKAKTVNGFKMLLRDLISEKVD